MRFFRLRWQKDRYLWVVQAEQDKTPSSWMDVRDALDEGRVLSPELEGFRESPEQRGRTLPDFPFHFGDWLASPRSVICLDPIIGRECIYMPIRGELAGYSLIVPTCELDALDLERSQGLDVLPSGFVNRIARPAVKASVAQGHSVFRLARKHFNSGMIFCSEEVVNAVEGAGLTGLTFQEAS